MDASLLLSFFFKVFTEIPRTLNVTAGIQAMFRCQHSDADTLAWRVNNRSIRQSPLRGLSQSQDRSTLTIIALPEYNGTLVECLALYFDGSPPDSAPPAYLIVEGRVVQASVVQAK